MIAQTDTLIADVVGAPPDGNDVEQLAQQRLFDDSPQAFYLREVSVEYSNGMLTLRGRVPTSRMKQKLWILLDDLSGVEEVENLVDVISATGLSSTHPK
jgi:osmotically-inducible protein OsmY